MIIIILVSDNQVCERRIGRTPTCKSPVTEKVDTDRSSMDEIVELSI